MKKLTVEKIIEVINSIDIKPIENDHIEMNKEMIELLKREVEDEVNGVDFSCQITCMGIRIVENNAIPNMYVKRGEKLFCLPTGEEFEIPNHKPNFYNLKMVQNEHKHPNHITYPIISMQTKRFGTPFKS